MTTTKKTYTTPCVKAMALQADNLLFAGSFDAKDEDGNNLDGISGGTPTETGTSTPVEADAKRFSVWGDEE